jgi:hypothetical protein
LFDGARHLLGNAEVNPRANPVSIAFIKVGGIVAIVARGSFRKLFHFTFHNALAGAFDADILNCPRLAIIARRAIAQHRQVRRAFATKAHGRRVAFGGWTFFRVAQVDASANTSVAHVKVGRLCSVIALETIGLVVGTHAE